MNIVKRIWTNLVTFFSNSRNVFFLGLLVTLVATSLEVFRGRASNYYVYSDAVYDFWHGINPYTMDFVKAHCRYFLYLPPFTVIFAPILLLPQYIGAFVWNIGNYILMFFSIHTLPQPLRQHSNKIFLFLLSILLQSIFCYQYNIVVCYIFLFAFTLLERNKPLLAVLLIMISACTKIYGGIELALLLCYPKVWRNIGFAALCGTLLILSPLLNTGFENPLGLYKEMAVILSEHNTSMSYIGILYAKGLNDFLLPNIRVVQLMVLFVLALIFFMQHKLWNTFRFKVQVIAVTMGFIILFSDAPETHTYVIALTGYLMAFFMQPCKKKLDWVLFWLLFINFNILPTDILCPSKVHLYIHNTFWLDVYTFTICWIRIIWWATNPIESHQMIIKKTKA